MLTIFLCVYWPFVSFGKCLLKPFAHFWIRLFIILLLSCCWLFLLIKFYQKSHACSFTYFLWLLPCYNDRVEELSWKLNGPQNLKHFLSGFLQEKFASPCCRTSELLLILPFPLGKLATSSLPSLFLLSTLVLKMWHLVHWLRLWRKVKLESWKGVEWLF